MVRLKVPHQLRPVIEALDNMGFKPILVGGYIRDSLLGSPGKDIDIEVHGADSLDALTKTLGTFGSVNQVGKSFGVLKLSLGNLDIDISLPRIEAKTGLGHRGFHVKHFADISFKEAAKRRDFTINSMGWDPIRNEILDPYNGAKDLQDRILRHVSSAFSEDPLRVLRGIQFAARFQFKMCKETQKLCRLLDLSELPKERLLDEWRKLLLKAEKPSIGLELLKELDQLKNYPELEKLIECPQDPEWHPEGDVWTHTLMVVDEMAALRTGEEKRDLILMLGALCHDLGKPNTTIFENGRWRSPNHESEGVEPTKQFLKRLTDEKNLIKPICDLVREHLKPALLYNDHLKNKVSDSAIRRLSLRVNLADLYLVTQADHFGRTTADALAKDFPAGKWLMERAEKLTIKDSAPKPLLMGRHLIALGYPKGPSMGAILKDGFNAQLEGIFSSEEDGIKWLKNYLKKIK